MRRIEAFSGGIFALSLLPQGCLKHEFCLLKNTLTRLISISHQNYGWEDKHMTSKEWNKDPESETSAGRIGAIATKQLEFDWV